MYLSSGPAKGFDLASVGLGIVSSLAVGLITNYLYDLIVRGAFANKTPTLTVKTVKDADGNTVIVLLKE